MKELNKFYLFLKNYIVELLKQIDNYSITVDNNIESILNNKDRILEIDGFLLNDINLISYFVSERLTEVPQVKESIERVVNSLSHPNVKIDDLKHEKEECEKILNNQDYDFDFFVSMLEKSDLTEEEKIEVLKGLALETCKVHNKTEEAKETKEEKPKLPDLESLNKKEDSRMEELMNKYESLRERIDQVGKTYHYLIRGKNERQIKYYESYVEATRLTPSETEKFEFKEYKIIVDVMRLFKCKTEADKYIHNHKMDEELLSLEIEEIEGLLSSVEQTGRELEKQKNEKDLNNARKIYFFTEDGIKPFFNPMVLDGDAKKVVMNIIRDIENGILDNPVTTTKKVLSEENHDYNTYVYLKNKMGLSFVKVSSNKILAITAASVKSVYSDTKSATKKFDNQVKKQMELIIRDDKDYNELQNTIYSSITSGLANGRKI